MHAVLADDQKLVADTLVLYLGKLRPDIEVSKAGNFGDALKLVSESADIDLVILDLDMPGMNGLEGLKTMRARHPDVPIVMLSGVAKPHHVREALNLGAAGFLSKHLSGEVMLGALELILSGGTYVPTMALAESAEAAPAETPRARNEITAESPLDRLTRREREVLSLLSRGYTNKAIAKEFGVAADTAAFHVKGVVRKLGARNRTDAVVTALRCGWKI